MNIILVGPPGAGKGTISSFLKKEYALPYLSPGDVFRTEINKGSELGILAKSLIDKGNFMPDEITARVVQNALSDMENGYILDGFPRNTAQVRAFEEMLKEKGMYIDVVLHIEVEDALIMNRLVHRQICPSCQSSYHKIDIPPKVTNQCDQCQTQLVTRKDDKPEYIAHRLEIYHANTEPIIAHYKSQGILATIDADCSLEVMCQRVIQALEGKGTRK